MLPYVPTIDPQRRLKQMASLATALTSIGVQFSDSLSYRYAPRTANRAAHEKGGMRVLRILLLFTLTLCPQPSCPTNTCSMIYCMLLLMQRLLLW